MIFTKSFLTKVPSFYIKINNSTTSKSFASFNIKFKKLNFRYLFFFFLSFLNFFSFYLSFSFSLFFSFLFFRSFFLSFLSFSLFLSFLYLYLFFSLFFSLVMSFFFFLFFFLSLPVVTQEISNIQFIREYLSNQSSLCSQFCLKKF
jgi:hypothetical protein